jgi:alpha-acetolactate decarboxylase
VGARAALLACVVLVGCSKDDESPTSRRSSPAKPISAKLSAGPAVRWYGALRAIMHEGRTASAVKLAEVLPGPHAWGVGALADLNGELTVVDDEVWLARPMPDGSAAITRGQLGGADSEQGAALFVMANVAAWQEVAIVSDVSWEQLDSFLESELRTRRLLGDLPVALRIDGPVSMLRWHVVDGSKLAPGADQAQHARTAVSGVVPEAEAKLVGFFSMKHQGVLTHAGSHSHFHAVVLRPLVSGHVDGVELRPGARLFIATN